METVKFDKNIFNSDVCRTIACVLADSTAGNKALTAEEAVTLIGFMEGVDDEVKASLQKRSHILKGGKEIPRSYDTVLNGLRMKRVGLFSTALSLGAFDGLVNDDSGNPIEFQSLLGVNGGVCRTDYVRPKKAPGTPGEPRVKNPDAWRKVVKDDPSFATDLKKALETLLAKSDHVVLLEVLKEIGLRIRGMGAEKILEVHGKWQNWVRVTIEQNPDFKDSEGHRLYVTSQGRSGGFRKATPEDFASPDSDKSQVDGSVDSTDSVSVEVDETEDVSEETDDSVTEEIQG